jgi:hypothetical protein
MIPALYAHLWLAMTKTANRSGYALALHGSMNRDLDVVAIPWTEDCDAPYELIYKFAKRHDLLIASPIPEKKPYGRRAWLLLLRDSRHYIDLSITPRLK